MNTNRISFKGKFEVDMPNKRNANISDVHKYYDAKIKQLQEERMKVLDTIEFMHKPEVQAKIAELPTGDTVFYAPIEEKEKGVESYNPIIFFEPGEETEDKLFGNGQYNDFFLSKKASIELQEGERPSQQNVGEWLNKLIEYFQDATK